ncbi:MAG: HNH endonuclease, partial [Oscillospiraceae bacterium]|nr:HNH endonuclease [Oscillospiraceae bacterium]
WPWEPDPLRLTEENWIDLLDRGLFFPEDIEMIGYVYGCPGHESTVYDMAKHFDISYNQVTAINRMLAKRILNDQQGIPFKETSGENIFWNIIYKGDPNHCDNVEGHFRWILRPALVRALEGVFGLSPTDLKEKPSEGKKSGYSQQTETFVEGHRRNESGTLYERNPAARKACLERYGLRCSVCGFDFEAVYGEIGRGKIAVHHLVPISQFQGQVHTISLHDLRPVCYNCHAMLHTKLPPLTIEELKEKLCGQLDGRMRD